MAATKPAQKEDGIPIELKEKLATFDTHLSELEMILSPVLSVNRINLTEKKGARPTEGYCYGYHSQLAYKNQDAWRALVFDELDPVDAAKTDLVAAYAINSLFWMYMNVCGVNPKEHSVRQELGRIQSYMQRVKEIEDKKKAPKLDKESTKRFVKNALWQAAKKKKEAPDAHSSSEPSPSVEEHTSKETRSESKLGKKRKIRD